MSSWEEDQAGEEHQEETQEGERQVVLRSLCLVIEGEGRGVDAGRG